MWDGSLVGRVFLVGGRPIYQQTWRNKWLTSEAETIGDMAEALQGAVDRLRAMEARGVRLRDSGSVTDDYAVLETDDPDVADEFGFEEPGCDGFRAVDFCPFDDG